jgi:hypothetical protein
MRILNPAKTMQHHWHYQHRNKKTRSRSQKKEALLPFFITTHKNGTLLA